MFEVRRVQNFVAFVLLQMCDVLCRNEGRAFLWHKGIRGCNFCVSHGERQKNSRSTPTCMQVSKRCQNGLKSADSLWWNMCVFDCQVPFELIDSID